MQTEPVAAWMKARFQQQANACAVLAPVAFFGGLIAAAFTLGFCFVAVFFAFKAVAALASLFGAERWRLTQGWWVTASVSLFLSLLGDFFRRGTTREEDFSEFGQDEVDWETAGRAFVIGGSPALLLMFPHASAHLVLDLLHIGPRMIRGTWRLLRSSSELRTLPVEPAAEVLATVLSQAGKIPWDEFPTRFGHLPVADVWKALRWFPGMVHLESGLTMTADFREEVRSEIQAATGEATDGEGS
jgi:hypothetical protein